MKLVIQRHNGHTGKIQFRIIDNVIHAETDQDTSADEVKQYIKANKNWFAKKLTTQINQTDSKSNLRCDSQIAQIFSGIKTLICGELIDVMSYQDKKPELIDVILYIKPQKFKVKYSRNAEVQKFLLRLAKDFLPQEISSIGTKMSLCPCKITIKALHSDQWIVCTNPKQREICLDYRVVQLPSKLRKFLMIHSFAHFYQAVHNYAFWQVVQQYMGNYTDCLNQLSDFSFLKM